MFETPARQRILGLERVEGADGIKSGFTNQAGFGFLGSAERDGRRLVSIVAGSPTGRMQKAASRAFLEWGFRSFEGHALFDQGEVVGEARVQGGSARTVPLIAQRPIGYDLPVGQTAKVTLSIRYEGPLRAPIAQGEQVAELEIAVEGLRPSRVPLVAAQPIEEANSLLYIAFAPAQVCPQCTEYAQTLSRGMSQLRQSGELGEILARYGLRDWQQVPVAD